MKRTANIIALWIAVAAPANAAPPLDGGAHCHATAKPVYRLSAVERHGLPVKITCDGAARVQIIFELVAMSPQRRELTRMFPNSSPGICRSRDVGLPAAGSFTVRPKLMPYGARIARRYPRTKLLLHFLTLREDGTFWSDATVPPRTVLVR